jgi:hypothetical protein
VARTVNANAHATDVMPYIEAARKAGCITPSDLARPLTARGIETPAGEQEWNTTQVRRILVPARKNGHGAETDGATP